MTVFYFDGDEACRKLKGAFDFFDGILVKSVEESVSSMDVAYSDEQIGFIVPCSDKSFPEEVSKLVLKSTLTADYFFAIVVRRGKASDAAGRFMGLCGRAGISLRYLESVSSSEDDESLSEKAIGFRNEAGLFVSRIGGADCGGGLLSTLGRVGSMIGKGLGRLRRRDGGDGGGDPF